MQYYRVICSLLLTSIMTLSWPVLAGGQVLAQAEAESALPPLPDEQPRSPKGISLWQPGDPGQRLFIDGSVLTPDGQGIAGAILSVRQADANGVYHPDRYRADLVTDQDGRYAFGTVLPGQYASVKHIHVYVQHDAYQPLQTEIVFMGDENLDESTQRRHGVFLEESTVEGETFFYGRFDITLRPAGG